MISLLSLDFSDAFAVLFHSVQQSLLLLGHNRLTYAKTIWLRTQKCFGSQCVVAMTMELEKSAL